LIHELTFGRPILRLFYPLLLQWRWLTQYTRWPQTHGRQTNTRSGDTGGGSEIICACQWRGKQTSASECFGTLPNLLVSEKVITLTEGIRYWMSCLNFKRDIQYVNKFGKINLGALHSPSCHNYSLTTSLPSSYILHSTLHRPHNTFISSHMHF